MNTDYAKETRLTWDTLAEWWAQETLGCDLYQRELIIPAIESMIKINEDENILDFGCGNGEHALRLAKQGAKVVGIDLSSKFVSIASERANELKLTEKAAFFCADVCDEQELSHLPEILFDGCVSIMVLHDVYHLEPVAKYLSKSIKGGGFFVMAIPHPCFNGNANIAETSIEVLSYATSNVSCMKAKTQQPVPHYSWNRPLSAYINALCSCGFAVVETQEPVVKSDNLPFPKIWSEIPPCLVMKFVKL